MEAINVRDFFLSRYKYFAICLLFIAFSCKSFHPLKKHNYFNGQTLYNDSINISIIFFGDIDFNKLKKNNIKNIKRSINGIKEVNQRKLLASGTTTDVSYNVLLFYKSSKNNTKDTIETIQLILKDTIGNKILYKKQKGNKTAFVFLETINSNKNIKTAEIDGLTMTESIDFDVDFEKKLTFSNIFETYKDNTNYLFVREKLKNAPIPKSKKNEWMQFQYLTTINSFMSKNIEYDSLIHKFQNSREKYLKPILDTLINSSKTIRNDSVIEHIALHSKNTQVVMLNENHWYPKHRVLAIQLLKPLKKAGYTHLALETIFNKQDSILNNHRPYPLLSSGYYSREPFYAHLIRKAKIFGFTIIGYENYDDNINRELGQAQNLIKILANNPESKIFVYAGLDHIIEKQNDRGKKMATIFKELTDIDPLTINQANIVSNTDEKLVLLKSSLFEKEEKISKNVDYYLINNIIPSLDSVFEANELSNVSIKNDVFNNYSDSEVMISVYFQEEYEKYKSNSVPILSEIVQIKNDTISIRVPFFNLVLKIMDKNNNTILIERIENK